MGLRGPSIDKATLDSYKPISEGKSVRSIPPATTHPT
jgi:hypothetical protein